MFATYREATPYPNGFLSPWEYVSQDRYRSAHWSHQQTVPERSPRSQAAQSARVGCHLLAMPHNGHDPWPLFPCLSGVRVQGLWSDDLNCLFAGFENFRWQGVLITIQFQSIFVTIQWRGNWKTKFRISSSDGKVFLGLCTKPNSFDFYKAEVSDFVGNPGIAFENWFTTWLIDKVN